MLTSDHVGAGVVGAHRIAVGAQAGEDALGIDQRLGTAEADHADLLRLRDGASFGNCGCHDGGAPTRRSGDFATVVRDARAGEDAMGPINWLAVVLGGEPRVRGRGWSGTGRCSAAAARCRAERRAAGERGANMRADASAPACCSAGLGADARAHVRADRPATLAAKPWLYWMMIAVGLGAGVHRSRRCGSATLASGCRSTLCADR